LDQSSDLERLLLTLDRETVCGSLEALAGAVRLDAAASVGLAETAIGIDANVFLKLSGHRAVADVLDYLNSRHKAPLILPGQAIQEFWNNQLQSIETFSASLVNRFSQLRDPLRRIDAELDSHITAIDDALEKYSSTHGHIYAETTQRAMVALIEGLQRRSVVPYVPRSEFWEIVQSRKRTKTPPGFKDDGDGDFFIWADLLYGLLLATSAGAQFSRVALVTLDRKPDWSRAGTAHPVLVAEVDALLGRPFLIWTIDQLADEIQRAT
jgi:hypothetical protein